MLVGSCVPTKAPFKIYRVTCAKPGCGYVATAMSDREALTALNDHWYRVRQTGEHGE